jgi:tRNA G26 N,N-dimethylase Trm1
VTTEQKLSPEAAEVMSTFITEQGLSYDEAIAHAERAAIKAAAPYKEVATYLRHWLEDHPNASLGADSRG